MKKTSNLPPWAKKIGLISLIVVAVTFAIEAILQLEIQNLWMSRIRPLLEGFLSAQIHLDIPLWLILGVIIASAVVGDWYLRHPRRTIPRKLNPAALPNPRGVRNPVNDNVDVFNARSKVIAGELSLDELVTIVEQRIHLGTLKPEAGAEILEEFGYEMILHSDRSYTAHRKENGR